MPLARHWAFRLPLVAFLMATLARSLVSSSSRKLPIRVRPDLTASRQKYLGKTYWVVKEPVGLKYYRFEEEEFAILQMLDGESSLDEIAERFETEFPPQTIRTEELQHFIGTLHRSGLVIADAPGQGEQLKKRRDERLRKEMIGKVSNILSIRFRGIDPERFLNYLYSIPPVRWFFSMPVFILCLMLCAMAGALVLVEFDVFRSKLPSFEAFFTNRSWENWLLMAVVLGCTKVMHEFGHGLSCKHFGGECHEMGVMLLVLTPCLYCNVSDSWMLPNRWHRAAIGAAGMYVEVVLASICTFIWWFTEPGLLNYVCLNIMFVSSVSTILFNANPLLRYDGYYILSDLLEIPNMRQKANSILSRKLAHYCLGFEEPYDPFLPERNQWLFALYTIAASIYRWVVLLSILYFLNQVFEPYGLKPIGQFIAFWAILSMIGQPMWKLYKYFSVPGRMGKVKRANFLATCVVLIAAISAVVWVPLPASVYCPFTIQPFNAASVYVEAPGILREVFVEPGDQVQEGDPLARLESVQIELSIVRLVGEIEALGAEIRSLQSISFDDERAQSQIAQLNETVASARRQLEKQREDADRLVLRAPRAGTVVAPDYRTAKGLQEKELRSWSGTPLQERNLGTTLQTGDLFCRVGNPESLEAALLIPQTNIDLVDEGQKALLMLNQTTDLAYTGRIKSISFDDVAMTPPRLSSLSGGAIDTVADESGVAKPSEPHFSASVPLVLNAEAKDQARAMHHLLRVGLVGEARIEIAPRTFGQRCWRYLSRTINLDL